MHAQQKTWPHGVDVGLQRGERHSGHCTADTAAAVGPATSELLLLLRAAAAAAAASNLGDGLPCPSRGTTAGDLDDDPPAVGIPDGSQASSG